MLLEDLNDLLDWEATAWPARAGQKPRIPPPGRWVDELVQAEDDARFETMGPL